MIGEGSHEAVVFSKYGKMARCTPPFFGSYSDHAFPTYTPFPPLLLPAFAWPLSVDSLAAASPLHSATMPPCHLSTSTCLSSRRSPYQHSHSPQPRPPCTLSSLSQPCPSLATMPSPCLICEKCGALCLWSSCLLRSWLWLRLLWLFVLFILCFWVFGCSCRRRRRRCCVSCGSGGGCGWGFGCSCHFWLPFLLQLL